MWARAVLLPGFVLLLLIAAQVTWTPVDSEFASSQLLPIDYGPLSGKAPIVLAVALLLPFLTTAGNPVARLGAMPCLLYALAGLSVLWSVDRGSTIFTLMGLTAAFGYPVAMQAWLGGSAMLRAIWWLASAIVAASVLLAAAGDTHALMSGLHEGAWRGVFAHKNAFGPFLGVHLLLTMFARRRLRVSWIVTAGIVLVDAAAMVLARSGTAMLACLSGVAVGLLLVPIAEASVRRVWRTSVLVVALAVGALLVAVPQLAFDALGRDATLSNRTIIWRTVYPITVARPLGAGYGTRGGEQVSIEVQKVFHRRDALGVQSGYVSLALELGWGAVILFAAWLAWALVRATDTRVGPADSAALAAALVIQHLVQSVSESAAGLYPGWSLVVLTAALVAFRLTDNEIDSQIRRS